MNETTQEVMTRLDALAAKLGEGINYFWPKLIYQCYLEGIFLLVGFSLFSLFLFGLAFKFNSYRKRMNITCSTDRDNYFELTVIMFISITAGFTVMITNVIINSPYMLNPEYYALEKLMKMF